MATDQATTDTLITELRAVNATLAKMEASLATLATAMGPDAPLQAALNSMTMLFDAMAQSLATIASQESPPTPPAVVGIAVKPGTPTKDK